MKSLKTVRTLSSAITAKVSIIATPNSIKTMELNQHTNTRGSMWNFAKKLALAGVSTLLVATASLSAAYNDYYDYDLNPGYNTGSNDFCCGDWSLEAEFLYWRANVDELPVGRSFANAAPVEGSVSVPGGGPTIPVFNGQQLRYFTKYLDSDWRPGARVTLGYHCPGSCWDWKLAWTWIYSRAKASLSDTALSDTNIIEPAWTSGASQPFVPDPFGPITGQYIRGNWGLNFNAIEFGAGYTFTACCDQFRVRPHFDVKYASIRQRATFSNVTDYNGVVAGALALPFSFVDQVQLRRDYNGVGPQIGVDVHYTLCGGFGLYAKAAAALLYAEPEIKFRGKVKSVSDTAVLNLDSNHAFRNRTDPRHINLNTTLGAGVEYSRYVCGGKYRAFAKIGWEHQLFTNQNQFHRAVIGPDSSAGISDILFPVEHGDLSLYGLTASIGFDY